LVCSLLIAVIASSSLAEGMEARLFVVCCVNSGLFYELITHPEESYRVCMCVSCVCVCAGEYVCVCVCVSTCVSVRACV
jgi:hypothetical protein